jgi:hypothetical protein
MFCCFAVLVVPFQSFLIPDRSSRAVRRWIAILATIGYVICLAIYLHDRLSQHNSFNVWSLAPIFKTLGLPGLISFIFAIWILLNKKFSYLVRCLGLLTLIFYAIVFIPPFPQVLSPRLTIPMVLYRLFYGSFYWFIFAFGLAQMFTSLKRHWRWLLSPEISATFVILLIGMNHYRPWYGRLEDLFVKGNAWATPTSYSGAIQFLESKSVDHNCKILSDGVGASALRLFSDFPAAPIGEIRFDPSPMERLPSAPEQFWTRLQQIRPCFVMLRQWEGGDISWSGSESGHWQGERGLARSQVSKKQMEIMLSSQKKFKLVYHDRFSYVFKPIW